MNNPYSETSPSNRLKRYIRAYMFLDADPAPPGVFFAPAIKKTGIVFSSKNNVMIMVNNHDS